jgi:hypothetical protein
MKIRGRKVETCGFGSPKWFLASISAHFAEAGKRTAREECSKYDLTTPPIF